MNDMRAVIVPKSDQLNADDLLAGPITITITSVTIRPGTEQPVSIFFEGDNGRPYKCCKSMARVMVYCWGDDANNYIGKSMTLYRDPKVPWGGMAVGGIRISHMSHIDDSITMALTATKGRKNAFTVHPLVVEKKAPTRKPSVTDWLDALDAELKGAETVEARDAIIARDQVQKAQQTLKNGALERLNKMLADAVAPPTDDGSVPGDEDDGWPGPRVENAPENAAA